MANDLVQGDVVDAAQVLPETPADDTQALNDIMTGSGLDETVEAAFGFPEPPSEVVETDSPDTVLETGGAILDTTPVTTDNDRVRYQYWQSEADKRENELSKVRATNELLTQQLTSFVSNTQQPQQQQQPEEQVEEFPPPPNKPDKPRTYNREEAYTDSSSESARYLDDIESWRDDMDEYNSLQAEYQSAKMSADREEYQRARQRDDALRQQASENDQRMGQLKTHLRQKYNASDTEFDEFVQIMSNPESLTPDNLWRLYQMDRGVQTNVPSAPAAPSAAFEQTRRAQSVPSPMGVLPSQNVQVSDRSVEDKLMDSIIEDQNRLNII